MRSATLSVTVARREQSNGDHIRAAGSCVWIKRASVAALLSVLVAPAASAQEASQVATPPDALVAPAAVAEAAPEAEVTPAQPEAPTRSEPEARDDPAARACYGTLAGVGLLGVTTLLGTMIAPFFGERCDPEDLCLNALLPPIGALIGLAAGPVTLWPLGVALGANAAGGRGHAGWTYLGGLIGSLTGAALVGLAWWGHDEMGGGSGGAALIATAIALGAGASLAGPFIAYEISDHHARARPEAQAAWWMPSFAIHPDGASVSVLGAF